MNSQFDDAAVATSRAFSQVRQQRVSEDGEGSTSQNMTVDEMLTDKKEKDDKKISPEIECMQPILRFLQLLCENHNRDLQVCNFARNINHWRFVFAMFSHWREHRSPF
jgi:hypothetical protein